MKEIAYCITIVIVAAIVSVTSCTMNRDNLAHKVTIESTKK